LTPGILKEAGYPRSSHSHCFSSTVGPASAQEAKSFANCHLGVGCAFARYVGDFDIAQLNIGLYLNWWNNTYPQSNLGLPADVEYIQTMRVHQNKVGGWDSDYVSFSNESPSVYG